MEYTEFTGKTVEDAVEKGLEQLGLTKASIMKSTEIGVPVTLTSKFEREAPMDASLPHGEL